MKKILTSMITVALLSLSSINVSAISAADFNPGKIIDDLVFFNKDSMTADQIQNFLNSKVTTCETNRPATSGDSSTVYSPPFICLKDFYENHSSTYQINYTYKDTSGSDKSETRTFYRNNAYEFTALTPNYKNGNFSEGIVSIKATVKSIAGVKPQGSLSAAQIIYNAAQKYNINPQVLLVTLQKEQGLITDSWPLAWQFQAAMGYGCPDNGPCSSKYSGFSSQVENAAWQFRAYTNNPNAYNFKAGVNRFVQFNPVSSCGGSNIYLQNQATANLYNYTPYQPNPGALANLSDYSTGGSATCGAYGNRNFFWYFNKWFGSTYAFVYRGVDYSSVFDPTYYSSKYSDINATFNGNQLAMFDHFINVGIYEGRQGSDSFNIMSYKSRYPDLRTAYGNDLQRYLWHYVTTGIKEGRISTGDFRGGTTLYRGVDYSTVYNFDYYTRTYPDIWLAYGLNDTRTLWHFINVGIYEGRQGSDSFNIMSYKSRYPDLRTAYGNDLQRYLWHYVTTGIKEGRISI